MHMGMPMQLSLSTEGTNLFVFLVFLLVMFLMLVMLGIMLGVLVFPAVV